MAQRLVVGIFPDDDPHALQQALQSQPAIDAANMRVVTASAPSHEHAAAPFDFIHVAAAQNDNSLSDTMTHGIGIMSDGGGTAVPGLAGSATPSSSFSTVAADDYLSDLGIPDDEVDNYNDAIASGRSVILYSSDDASAAEELRAAGVLHIRSY